MIRIKLLKISPPGSSKTNDISREKVVAEKIPEVLKTHEADISEVEIKCTECEFVTTSENGIKVHKAKKHTRVLQCEICDFKAQTLNVLQIHIVTCELYKCSKCDHKSRRLSQVKAHIPKHHGAGDYFLTHLKMSRDNPDEVCESIHYLKDI